MMAIETDILAQIKKYDTIIIHRHQRPDPDAYGSQVGLAEIIRASFPKRKSIKSAKWSAALTG